MDLVWLPQMLRIKEGHAHRPPIGVIIPLVFNKGM